jgi:hypothetical protein
MDIEKTQQQLDSISNLDKAGFYKGKVTNINLLNEEINRFSELEEYEFCAKLVKVKQKHLSKTTINK